jgi:hypothetical protein
LGVAALLPCSALLQDVRADEPALADVLRVELITLVADNDAPPS